MTFPSFPTVASERQVRAARTLDLRQEPPRTEKARVLSPTARATQSDAGRASVGMPRNKVLALDETRDELDLSPEAMAFLLGTPPLAGSQKNSTFPEQVQNLGQANSAPSEPTQRLTETETESTPLVAAQENNATASEPFLLGGLPEADTDLSTDVAIDDETDTATEDEEATAEAEPDTEQNAKGSQQLAPEEEELVERLAERDREVRTHEQAHMNAAGPYAQGGPTYAYQKGPDGKQYAVGGEVQIDTAPVPNDPEATIRKAQIVRAAALAPAEPSSQDKAVASAATKMQQQAQSELLQQRMAQSKGEENQEEGDNSTLKSDQDNPDESPEASSSASSGTAPGMPSDATDQIFEESKEGQRNDPPTELSEASQVASQSFGSPDRESASPGEVSRAYSAETRRAPQNTMPSGRPGALITPASSQSLLDVRW